MTTVQHQYSFLPRNVSEINIFSLFFCADECSWNHRKCERRREEIWNLVQRQRGSLHHPGISIQELYSVVCALFCVRPTWNYYLVCVCMCVCRLPRWRSKVPGSRRFERFSPTGWNWVRISMVFIHHFLLTCSSVADLDLICIFIWLETLFDLLMSFMNKCWNFVKTFFQMTLVHVQATLLPTGDSLCMTFPCPSVTSLNIYMYI